MEHRQAQYSDLQVQGERLLRWFAEDALPFWQSAGIDGETGGAWESVDAAGLPCRDAIRRTRVQTRQMFVYALAQECRWTDTGQVVVESLANYLNSHAVNPDFNAAYVHALTPDNKVADRKIDTYDLAFTLLACAWRYRTFGEEQALGQAETIFKHLQSELATTNGGFREGNYRAPWRRQNPHMHLLEAFLGLFEATGDEQWLSAATAIVALFERHFFDAEHGVLLEYFDEDWQPVEVEGEIPVKPGHMMEWAWLLDHYGQLSSTPPNPRAETLYTNALRHGTDPDSGLLFDAVSPIGAVLAASKRLWPQTEAIRAHLLMARRGDGQAGVRAAKAIAALFDYYMEGRVSDDRVPGGRVAGTYADCVDADNNTMSGPSPASSMYHLATAVCALREHI